jgi:hypothetical protein
VNPVDPVNPVNPVDPGEIPLPREAVRDGPVSRR